MSEIGDDPVEKVSTGPWDNTFHVGLARTGVYLLGGPPGAGKTTLLLQIAGAFPGVTLYASAEQSKFELKDVWSRLKITRDIRVCSLLENDDSLEVILEECEPDLLILDSLQGLCGDDAEAHNTTCSFVKRYAVRKKVPAIIVSHITKDELLAGRLTVQHTVDATCMLYLSEEERILTTMKNRYGPSFVETAFRMTEAGLVPLSCKSLSG